MTDDQGRTKKEFGRLEKAKGRLQQSFPEIEQLIRTTNAIDVARKIVGPARSMFRQFADDIQLKDLLAKAEALVANTDRTFTKAASKDTPPVAMFRGEPSSDESQKSAGAKKPFRPKKAAPKKTVSKKKKKQAIKRRAKARA